MATYAIGDIQGCTDALRRLLDRIAFEPNTDRLWFVGDLVNRGPDSVGALRLIRALGDRATVVLGNHDLHLLAVAAGGKPGRTDTIDDVLNASDRDELLDWLRTRPLMHHDPESDWNMIHAGLPPQWTIEQAERRAREAEAALRGPDQDRLFARLYGNEPSTWRDELTGIERLRFTINALTRLRYCTPSGRMLLDLKGAPDRKPDYAIPWFEAPQRKSRGASIVFGHWSMLGRMHWPGTNVWGIDTGCLWGGCLSALCLDTKTVISCRCRQYRGPG